MSSCYSSVGVSSKMRSWSFWLDRRTKLFGKSSGLKGLLESLNHSLDAAYVLARARGQKALCYDGWLWSVWLGEFCSLVV